MSAAVRIQGKEVSEAGYSKPITTNIKGIRESVTKFGRFIKDFINY